LVCSSRLISNCRMVSSPVLIALSNRCCSSLNPATYAVCRSFAFSCASADSISKYSSNSYLRCLIKSSSILFFISLYISYSLYYYLL
jgi:hypothetical protein